MTQQEIHQIIAIARRAPLANMAEAERVALLLQKLVEHFAPKVGDVPTQSDEGGKSTKPEGAS